MNRKIGPFIDGLAVVEETTIYQGDELICRGIIDENQQIVLSPQSYYEKIDIFDHNNAIVMVYFDNNVTQYNFIHFKKENIFKAYNRLKTYKKINDKVIVVDNQLYDIVKGNYTSRKFSDIGDFKANENLQVVAMTIDKRNFPNNLEGSYEMRCYVDLDGVIRSPLLCSYDNMIYVINNDLDYNNLIEMINNKIIIDVEEKTEILESKSKKILEIIK